MFSELWKPCEFCSHHTWVGYGGVWWGGMSKLDATAHTASLSTLGKTSLVHARGEFSWTRVWCEELIAVGTKLMMVNDG